MVGPFVYTALPTRVVFGRGKISEAAAEARRLGMKRPLVITTYISITATDVICCRV